MQAMDDGRPAVLIASIECKVCGRIEKPSIIPPIYMIPKLPFVNSQRSQRRRCIVSHGSLTYGLVLWFLVVPIEPDRGHRLEKCENYATSSGRIISGANLLISVPGTST